MDKRKKNKKINITNLLKKHDVILGLKVSKEDEQIEEIDTDNDMESQILEIYFNFFSNLNRVNQFFILNNQLVEDQLKQLNDQFIKTIKDNIVDEREGEKLLWFTYKEHANFKQIIKDRNIYGLHDNILSKSMLTYFHSLFETFISKTLHLIYCNNEQQCNDDNIKFTFKNLLEFDSIQDAKDYIIRKKISNILYDSIENQINTLLNILWVAKEDKRYFPINELIEISLRRNLFTHEDWIVNDVYINKCKINNISHRFKKWEKIIFEDEYFNNIYLLYNECLVKVIYYTRLKLSKDKDKYNDISNIINNRLLEMIKNWDLQLWLKITNFMLNHKFTKKMEESTYLLLSINEAIIYKQLGKDKIVKEKINKIDWSAKSNLFKFAKHILLEEWGKAWDLMFVVINKWEGNIDDTISKSDLKEWPLFFEFRNQKIFKENFKKIFSEEYVSEILS